jgi:hypothetical protein
MQRPVFLFLKNGSEIENKFAILLNNYEEIEIPWLLIMWRVIWFILNYLSNPKR